MTRVEVFKEELARGTDKQVWVIHNVIQSSCTTKE